MQLLDKKMNRRNVERHNINARHMRKALMDETDHQFQAAADFVESRASDLQDTRKLQLYGLYKQACSGPCATAKPSLFDFKGRAKWWGTA